MSHLREHPSGFFRRCFCSLLVLAVSQIVDHPLSLWAQEPSLTIAQAVDQAIRSYPAIKASREDASAAAAGVELARTAYLPRADVLGQLNRATRNNTFGMLLPQGILPSLSGPVLGTNGLTNVWGSALGLLVSWEPFDFGLRQANVSTAESGRKRAEAGVEATRLQVAMAAADAFLALLASRQAVIASQAGVERARILGQVTDGLVQSGLRPGADAARARAEQALAETQLAQSQQAVDVARAALANLLGISPARVKEQPDPLLGPPPQGDLQAVPPADHPFARQQSAAVGEAQALEHALERSHFPRFSLQGSVYARGTGAQVDGSTGGAFSGLGPNVQDWAIGFSMTFPLTDFFSIRAREQVAIHQQQAAAARYNRVMQDLNGQLEQAKARLRGARRVAQSTPAELDAARAAQQQAEARYKSGLGSIVEIADADRLLIQAEIDNSIANLSVWQALLGVAAAQGDLQPFLQLASK
jgi:outer membrane protein